jgi:hypothetical protein
LNRVKNVEEKSTLDDVHGLLSSSILKAQK